MAETSLFQYSIELSLLLQLLHNKLITEKEFQKVKMSLMRTYKIISDLTCSSI